MADLLFGVEIEFLGLGNEPGRIIERLATTVNSPAFCAPQDRILRIERSNHQSYWTLKGDGSVHAYCSQPNRWGDACGSCSNCQLPHNLRRGAELVSPPLAFNENGLGEVYRMASALQSLSTYANKTCGFHVHFDARWVRQLGRNSTYSFMNFLISSYANDEEIFDELVAESRRQNKNEYCRSMNGKTYNEDTGDRYYKLNTAAFLRHGTIEFRQHHGTVDPMEIINWIRICADFYTRKRDEFVLRLSENEFNRAYGSL